MSSQTLFSQDYAIPIVLAVGIAPSFVPRLVAFSSHGFWITLVPRRRLSTWA
jgi:hypothetical protein